MRGKLKENTRAANTNMERGDQLMKISPHNKYDGTRISGHIQTDLPKTNFPYSLARPDNRRQRNKGGNWRVAYKWSSITCKPSLTLISKGMDKRMCINSKQQLITEQ